MKHVSDITIVLINLTQPTLLFSTLNTDKPRQQSTHDDDDDDVNIENRRLKSYILGSNILVNSINAIPENPKYSCDSARRNFLVLRINLPLMNLDHTSRLQCCRTEHYDCMHDRRNKNTNQQKYQIWIRVFHDDYKFHF